MDKIKSQFLNGFKKIFKFVGECFDKVKQNVQQQQQLQQVQFQQVQKQQFQNMLMAIMREIARELFEAWGGVTYPNLHRINDVRDIRPAYYVMKDGRYKYTFKLLKSTDKKLNIYQCEQIMKYLNADIQATRQILINAYGLPNVQITFPYLAKGITVIKVQDTGLDVDVTVIV